MENENKEQTPKKTNIRNPKKITKILPTILLTITLIISITSIIYAKHIETQTKNTYIPAQGWQIGCVEKDEIKALWTDMNKIDAYTKALKTLNYTCETTEGQLLTLLSLGYTISPTETIEQLEPNATVKATYCWTCYLAGLIMPVTYTNS